MHWHELWQLFLDFHPDGVDAISQRHVILRVVRLFMDILRQFRLDFAEV